MIIGRIDMTEEIKKMNEIAAQKQAEKQAIKEKEEVKQEISIDDFFKTELKVAEIIACEKVEKSNKLLHETVKFGNETRSVVSGIAKHYTPEEMVGKKVMVLVNLKPAKLAGVLSEGMLLCAEDAEGNLALLKPEKDMPSGAEIA